MIVGASFTETTVMAIVSSSVRGPPKPVLPWSLVMICRLAAPLKLGVGANDSPSSAALMLAMVPVKVIVASAVPSPVLKARPAVPLSVILPLVPFSVTLTELPPASTSLIEIRLPPPALNTSGVSSLVL